MQITVKVIPRAKKTKIQILPDTVKVYLTVPALEGKANKKLCEVLAAHYGVKRYQVHIVKGQKSREKIVEIDEDS